MEVRIQMSKDIEEEFIELIRREPIVYAYMRQYSIGNITKETALYSIILSLSNRKSQLEKMIETYVANYGTGTKYENA